MSCRPSNGRGPSRPGRHPSSRRWCLRAARPSDGTVLQCDEQGLLACFGYPVAHEDAARRAAEAGLRLLDEVTSLGGPLPMGQGGEVKPWVSLHTGPALVEVKGDAVSLV